MSQAKPVYMHDNTRPISFDHHNFDYACYEASELSIIYNNHMFNTYNEKKLCPSKKINDEKYWGGGYGGVSNFPPPAKIKWRAKDGTPLEASIDIGLIFKEQVILHKEDPKQLTKYYDSTPSDPDIILEVNNRTINVYMLANMNVVPEGKSEQKSENILRRSLTLAYSKTY
jgi:hypothetical protein